MIGASYILPLWSPEPLDTDLAPYLQRIAALVQEVVVVDGSPSSVFDRHAAAWGDFARHVRPAMQTPMGKVAGVLTGVRLASCERLVIADDDVRYDPDSLRDVVALLDEAEVVRPQNVFRPRPWHARWDTGRILLNRVRGGDWPGTLAVRRSALLATDGYRGDVLFENLELVRTIRAAGGRELVPLDLFVERLPATTTHFLSQRVRQAYDEWARPSRFAAELALLPIGVGLALTGSWALLGSGTAAAVGLAELGRRRGGGRHAFEPSAALWAPLWLLERALTSWLAFGSRFLLGGVRYRGGRLRDAASPRRALERRLAGRIQVDDARERGTRRVVTRRAASRTDRPRAAESVSLAARVAPPPNPGGVT